MVKLGRPNRYRKKERPALFDVLKELPQKHQEKFSGHRGSPFTWLETATKKGSDMTPIGGFDDFSAWCKATFPDDKVIAAANIPISPLDMCDNPDGGCAGRGDSNPSAAGP